MRGQAALEYLLIFAAMLAILATITWARIINPTQEAGRDTLYLSQARSAADAIAEAMNSVYANGQGAVKSASFTIDRGWSLYLENAGGEENVRVSIKTSESVENIRSSLRYGFNDNLQNLSAGTYTVIVEWSEANNSITLDEYKITININPLED